MLIPKSNFLYLNYNFIKIIHLVNFFFHNKYFLLHSIIIQQTINKILILIIKYFFIQSFFQNELKYLSNIINNKINFEYVFVKSLFDITPKSFVISFFNLKKIYSKKFKKIQLLCEQSILKKSFFLHNISIYVITLLIFSINNARLLAEYICLELKSTRNHNAFILFLKSLLYFIITIINHKKYLKIVGFRILLSGRFNGQSRSKIKQLRIGLVGLQTIENNIDFYKCYCATKFGTFGLKIWVNYI